MKLCEAIQRLNQHKMRLKRHLRGQWIVVFAEDTTVHSDNSYITDDLEDAAIQASRMRLRRLASI